MITGSIDSFLHRDGVEKRKDSKKTQGRVDPKGGGKGARVKQGGRRGTGKEGRKKKKGHKNKV